MFKENQAEFDKSNITLWHNSGYKGKGATIVVLDDRGLPFSFTNVETPFIAEHRTTNHNTHICCVAREIAPQSKIISIPWTGTTTDHRKKVIEWIIEHKDEIDVVNCSFGSSHIEFDKLMELDIPIVCASGNNYSTDRINRPARYDWTIAIGAVSEASGHVVSESNGGAELDAVAYSYIVIPKVDGSTWSFSGTSCSSIVISSMLAIYIGFRKENNLPRLNREEIKRFIHTNSIDMYERGHDHKSGYGLFVLPETIPNIEVVEPPIIIPEEPVIPKEDNNMADFFKDDNGKWHEQFNNKLAELGIINGDGQGNVRPDDNITRGEVNKIAAVLYDTIMDAVNAKLGK